jgi:hypothetical protein
VESRKQKAGIQLPPLPTINHPPSTIHQQASAAERVESRTAQSAAPSQPSPLKMKVEWDLPAGPRVTYWDITTNLLHWEFGGWTTNASVDFPTTNTCLFFRFVTLPPSHSLRIGVGQIQPPDFFGVNQP